MKKTKILTLCSLFSALGVVLLYIGTLFSVFDFTFAAAVSLIIVFFVIEINKRAAFIVYFVTATLALILLPNKSIAVLYATFFGYYPILKSLFERFFLYATIVLKLLFFLFVSVFVMVFSSYFFSEGSFFDKHKFLILYAGVSFFFIYDFLFTKLITVYIGIIRIKLNVKKLLK